MSSKRVGNFTNSSVKLKFMWEINDFQMSCKNVYCLQSPMLRENIVGGKSRWCLRLFPKEPLFNSRSASEDADKDYLLIRVYTDMNVKSQYNFKIISNAGKEVANKTIRDVLIANSSDYLIIAFKSQDFIGSSLNDILDHKITIACEVTVSQYEENEKELNINKEVLEEQEDDVLISPFRVIAQYEALIDDKKFSDVSLISEGKSVKVHKCILAQSSVFAAMFDVKMKEKQENTVEIADIKYDVLLEMVRFIYTGKVDNIDVLAGELATAADKYALDDLKIACEKTMIKNLSLDNVMVCLQIADRLRMGKLKETTIEYIVKNSRSITGNPDFKSLPSDLLCEICCAMSKKIEP